jgi:hypothetical protein
MDRGRQTGLLKEPTMSGNATMNDGRGRLTIRLAEAQIQWGSAHGHRRVDVLHEVARPILNTVTILKMLRQAFCACRERDAWWPLKYDLTPDDGLTLIEYGVDELDSALEALGDLETLIKASERGATP